MPDGYLPLVPKKEAEKNIGDWVNGKQITGEDFYKNHTWNPQTNKWEQNDDIQDNWWKDDKTPTDMWDEFPEYQIPQEILDLIGGNEQAAQNIIGAAQTGADQGMGFAQDAMSMYSQTAQNLLDIYSAAGVKTRGYAQDQMGMYTQAGQDIKGTAAQSQAMLNQEADKLVSMYGMSRQQALGIAKDQMGMYGQAAGELKSSALADQGLARGEAGKMRDDYESGAQRLEGLYGGMKDEVMGAAKRERREVMGELTGMRDKTLDIYQQRAYGDDAGFGARREELGAAAAGAQRGIRDMSGGTGAGLGAMANLYGQQQAGMRDIGIQEAIYKTARTGELGEMTRLTGNDVAQGYRNVAQDYIDANIRSTATMGAGLAQATELRGRGQAGYIDTVMGTGVNTRNALGMGAEMMGRGYTGMMNAEMQSAANLGQGMYQGAQMRQQGYQGVMDASYNQADLMGRGYTGMMNAEMDTASMMGQGMYQGANLMGQGYQGLSNASFSGANMMMGAYGDAAGLRAQSALEMANQKQLEYNYNQFIPHQMETQFLTDQYSDKDAFNSWLEMLGGIASSELGSATGGSPY